jgi:hypothetical protein
LRWALGTLGAVVTAVATLSGLLGIQVFNITLFGGDDASGQEESAGTAPSGEGDSNSERPGDSGLPDYTVFTCGDAANRAGGRVEADQIIAALGTSGLAGAIDDDVWGGDMYYEIPLEELYGQITVIQDADHPEADDAARIADYLAGLDLGRDASPVRLVDNTGDETPWRISIVSCPRERPGLTGAPGPT